MSLNARVALVTGAGSGIGKAIALVLAERGADIAVTGRRLERLDETANAVRGLGRRALAVSADVAASDQVRHMVKETVGYFGRIDILVNNAGHNMSVAIEEMRDDDWQRMLDVYLNGTFYCTREVVPVMKAQGAGKIINISSLRGQIGGPGQVCYSTAKAGLFGFTKALAKELAPYRINVNAIAPGKVETPMISRHSPEALDARRREIPWQRFARSEEIGYLAAFLASEESDYITGQVLGINGGAAIVGI